MVVQQQVMSIRGKYLICLLSLTDVFKRTSHFKSCAAGALVCVLLATLSVEGGARGMLLESDINLHCSTNVVPMLERIS